MVGARGARRTAVRTGGDRRRVGGAARPRGRGGRGLPLAGRGTGRPRRGLRARVSRDARRADRPHAVAGPARRRRGASPRPRLRRLAVEPGLVTGIRRRLLRRLRPRPRAGLPRRRRHRRGHAPDRRRRRVRRHGRLPGGARPRPALLDRHPARPRTPGRDRAGAAQRRFVAGPAGPAHRGRHGGGRARLAGPAGRRVRADARAAAAVGARRPVLELERLGLAVEPVADGGARLRGPAPRPGAVARLRP